MGSRAFMTLPYAAGVLFGFALNRKITFGFRGDWIGALTRYVASQAIGYTINLAGLWLLVDRAGFRHEWV
jgi:putative flippase GtrA